ncbi:MAG: N-acetylmuramoyl-L-alanine amidase [Methylococcales bacterium]
MNKSTIDPVQIPSEPRITAASISANEFVVAIDAGHGGNDSGAKGVRGTREKDVVLSVSKKLERLVAREPGMRAVLIRDGDYFVALRNRMRIARSANADIFVSIHADAYHQSEIRGSSVYTLSQKGASSEAARWLAAGENESDRLGGVRLDDKDDMLAEVLLDLSQTATLDASADLANQVLGNLRQLGKVHKRRVQSAGFAVLKSPDIPSILVETAFISNPHEEKNLRDPNYQGNLAKAILSGVRKYYRERTLPALYMAARKHVIEPGETLSGIARRYGLSTRELQAANTLRSTRIKAGQILEIPAGS